MDSRTIIATRTLGSVAAIIHSFPVTRMYLPFLLTPAKAHRLNNTIIAGSGTGTGFWARPLPNEDRVKVILKPTVNDSPGRTGVPPVNVNILPSPEVTDENLSLQPLSISNCPPSPTPTKFPIMYPLHAMPVSFVISGALTCEVQHNGARA